MPLDERLKAEVLQIEGSDLEELMALLQKKLQRPKRERPNDENDDDAIPSKITRKASSGSSDKSNSLGSNPSQFLYVTDGMITAAIDNGIYISSRSATPEQVASQSSDPSSSLKLLDAGSQSEVTTLGDAKFNSQVLLTIDPTKINGQISISFTTERSDTFLGSVQGDHTIPERLLLEFIAKTIAGKTLEEIPKTLHQAFQNSVQDFDDGTRPLPEKPAIIPYEMDDDKSRKLGIRFQNASSVANYISQIIDRYNHLPLSVLPKDGHASIGEGTKVSTNMTMLRAMNELLSFETNIEGNLKVEDIDLFYKEAVLPNGKFVKGMKDFFGMGKIDDVRTAYLDTPEGRAAFCEEFAEKCDESKVGQLMSEIFDFPHRDSFGIPKDVERVQENLHILTRRYTKMCLGAFPQFEEKLDSMRIGIEFENLVIQKSVNFKIGKGSSATTLSGSWSGHAGLQDWDSVFPLDGDIVVAALKDTKDIYLEKLDSDSLKNSREIIDDANRSFQAMGIKFKLVVKEDFAENCNFEAVINGILQNDKLALEPLSGRFSSITRQDLQSLFQEKSQELGRTQRVDERGER